MITTGQDRTFLFEYHFGGSTWGIQINAADPLEAREKIKAVGMAAYQGEVFANIRVPGESMWRFWHSFRRLWQEVKAWWRARRR